MTACDLLETLMSDLKSSAPGSRGAIVRAIAKQPKDIQQALEIILTHVGEDGRFTDMSVFRIAKSVKLTPEIKAAFTHMFVKQSAKGDVWSLSQLFANHRELKEVWIEVLKGYKTDLASYKNYYAKSVQGDFAHALRKNDPQEYIQLARETLEERPRGAPLAQIHKTHLVFLIDMARSNSEAKIAVQTLVKDPLLLEAAQEEYPEGLESLKL